MSHNLVFVIPIFKQCIIFCSILLQAPTSRPHSGLPSAFNMSSALLWCPLVMEVGINNNKNKLPECPRCGRFPSVAQQNDFPVLNITIMKYCLLSSFNCVLALMQNVLKSRSNFISYFESFKRVFI